MKLLLLHGPAIVSSRKKLTEIKEKFDPANIVVFEKGSDMGQVMDNLKTQSLFGGEQLFILENPSDEIIPKLMASSHNIIFWFDKEADTKKFPGFQAFFFPEAKEVSVFPLLRLLGSRKEGAYTEINKLKEAGFENQYFITMILYLLRNLVVTPKKAAEFVKQNNEKMRKNFSRDELVNLYKNILEIDFKIKKGLMEESQAEHLLISRFLN